MSVILGNKNISRFGNDVYVIAEIGQNHQGCVETAKNLILEAKKANVDCVKFQKSCLTEKFTSAALNRKYDSINSFGSTYGEHKEFLELSPIAYQELQQFCDDIQIDFTASAMDEVSMDFLDSLNVPFIKIGSGDANNFPLLEKAAQLKRSLIISTGMQNMQTIERIVDIMRKARKTNFSLLHCVSSYPTDPKDCRLQMIPMLTQKFPDVVIGYSGHELGVDITLTAVLLGAKIIERHFTLDKSLKGSDHRCSLVPKELQFLTESLKEFKAKGWISKALDIGEIKQTFHNNKDVEQALEKFMEKTVLKCELPCKLKLGKSLVAATELQCGQKLNKIDLKIKVSEPNGMPAEDYDKAIGATLNKTIEIDTPIKFEDIQ